MPVIVAYGAATKLGGTPVYSMVAAAALLHRNFLTLVTAGDPIELFAIPVRLLNYGTSLLPALLIAIVAYYAEKFFNKIVPGIFRSVFVGLGTIFVAGTLGFTILAPLGSMLGGYIAGFFMLLDETVGALAVGFLAACLPWLVMAGMHTALVPFMVQLLTKPGFDSVIRPAFIMHNMAEGGAVLGVAARTKNPVKRSEYLSIAIGCIVAGVTEPAIYGVNLKYKKPMIGVMAGGATVTFILGIEDASKKKIETLPENSQSHSNDEIIAVTDGEMIPITQVNNAVFSNKALGEGVAFIPDSDFICAPANGKLTVMFETGHAFAITMNDGTELLVHIGINTVELKGKGFESIATQGDNVKAGQPTVKLDREFVKGKGYDISTMLIITNDNGKNLAFDGFGKKSSGEILLNTK